MNDRTVPDEFDSILLTALSDVSGAVQPDPGLADLLVANARAGRPVVASLAGRRRARRWASPLLAAASIVALSVGVAVVAGVVSDGHDTRPLHQSTAPVPTPSTPTPSTPTSPALPHFRAGDLYFSDAQHGWALGDAQCASSRRTDCPALLVTSNGGASWRPLDVPKGLVSTFDSASCGTNGTVAGRCVDAVLFANESDGYLWSLHELYWTTDGGHSWSRFVDPAHQWDGAARLVVAGGAVVRIAPVAPCSSGCPGIVETAPVGTTHWRVTTPTTQQVGLYSANLAVAGANVYLFAGGTYANTSAGIYRSSDGGGTWTLVASHVCGAAADPQHDPFWGAGSGAADNGALVVDCLGPRTGGIRVAPPGSTVFSPSRAYPPAGVIELEAARSEQRIVVADTSHAYTGNRIETTFYATDDGGRHWQRTATLPVRGDGLRFATGADGYAIGTNRADLYVTDDGGVSWHRTQFGS